MLDRFGLPGYWGLFSRLGWPGPWTAAAAPPLLVGARTSLRAGRRADWSEWAALRAKSRDFLTPWEPTWPVEALSRSTFCRRLRQLNGEAQFDLGQAFFIIRRDDQALLGGITLSNIRRGIAQSCSVGYWIGKPYARQGYMREALDIVCRHVFQNLGLHRLEAACLPENLPSQGLLRAAGFRAEGLARDYLRIDGRWSDHLLFALLEPEWRLRQNGAAAASAFYRAQSVVSKHQPWPASPDR